MSPILMTKVKNALAKTGKDLEFVLQNININGEKRGCSGFIVNKANNTVVYINTERVQNRLMYRYADNTKDFRGYHNRWANDFEELISSVDELLAGSPEENNDFRI